MSTNDDQFIETENTPTDANDFTDVFALLGKDTGCSLQLKGKVVLITFLVNDGESSWDSESEEAAVKMLKAVSTKLMADSKLNKKQFQVAYAYCQVSLPYIVNRSNSKTCIKDVLRLFGYDSIHAYQKHYEDKFSRDDTAVTLLFNKDFRSYALSSEKSDFSDKPSINSDEYSIVSFDKNDSLDSERSFLHELLHQFGAIDYYYPEYLKIKAQKIFPDSIMNGGSTIDDLTRYIIGWDNELSESAKKFLNEIKIIPKEDISFARNEEWLNE